MLARANPISSRSVSILSTARNILLIQMLVLGSLFMILGNAHASAISTTGAWQKVYSDSIDQGSGVERRLDCPSASQCFMTFSKPASSGNGMIGGIKVTNDGGTTWSEQVLPANTPTLNDIDCPSITNCFAVGNDSNLSGIVIETTNGGLTWTKDTVPQYPYDSLNAITCISTTVCLAGGEGSNAGVGNYLLKTTDGGDTWYTVSIPGGDISIEQFSCPTSSTCYAVGFFGAAYGSHLLKTTDGGDTWVNVPIMSQLLLSYPRTISCTSALHCLVGGSPYGPDAGSIYATSDGGATWSVSLPPLVSGYFIFYDIECADASICYAGGQLNDPYGNDAATLIKTDDGGQSWYSQTIPSSVFANDNAAKSGVLHDIACASTGTCYITGEVPENATYGQDTEFILRGPINITPQLLPTATALNSYNVALTAEGGVAPYTWSIQSGSLPLGLSLSQSGTLSGFTLLPGTSTFTVAVTDSSTHSLIGTITYHLTVNL